MRNRYRESTLAILEFLARTQGTCQDVAAECGLGITNVGSLLLRLARMGHVDRQRARQGVVVIDKDEKITRPRYVYLYSITPKGSARLKWIKNPGRGTRNR